MEKYRPITDKELEQCTLYTYLTPCGFNSLTVFSKSCVESTDGNMVILPEFEHDVWISCFDGSKRLVREYNEIFEILRKKYRYITNEKLDAAVKDLVDKNLMLRGVGYSKELGLFHLFSKAKIKYLHLPLPEMIKETIQLYKYKQIKMRHIFKAMNESVYLRKPISFKQRKLLKLFKKGFRYPRLCAPILEGDPKGFELYSTAFMIEDLLNKNYIVLSRS